jgi:type IV pilus assembly protein PilC
VEFRCRLGTVTGEVMDGVYVADDEARLRADLENRGLLVLSVKRKGGLLALARRSLGNGYVGQREFLIFNQELATLLKAGIPLVQSLDILRQRVANLTLKAILDDVHGKVRAGSSLSDAFLSHVAQFPPIYAATLIAGERAGDLEGVLRRYVAYAKVVGNMRQKAISALIYPTLLVGMMVGLVGVIVLMVVPSFADFYAGFDAELPFGTKLIVGLSELLLANYWLILGALLAVGALVVGWSKQPGHSERMDRMILRVPWVGQALRKFATAQFARTLATLLGGGIPLVNALETGADSLSNRFLAGEIRSVSSRVREGQAFATALRERQVLSDMAMQMVEVGESTGALQEMLQSLADFYDEEIETEMGRAIALVEPVLLILMGVVIAGVVLALYLPLFELSSVMH